MNDNVEMRGDKSLPPLFLCSASRIQTGAPNRRYGYVVNSSHSWSVTLPMLSEVVK